MSNIKQKDRKRLIPWLYHEATIFLTVSSFSNWKNEWNNNTVWNAFNAKLGCYNTCWELNYHCFYQAFFTKHQVAKTRNKYIKSTIFMLLKSYNETIVVKSAISWELGKFSDECRLYYLGYPRSAFSWELGKFSDECRLYIFRLSQVGSLLSLGKFSDK